jgi:phosphohistidine phosphatase
MPGPYEIYVIRHGLAEERGDAFPDDARRPLSEDGISSMRKAARGLGRLGVTIDVVLTSALVRAKQTAELVAGGLNPRPPVSTVESLAPGGTYQEIVADLEKQSRRKRIALVGHEPGIGEFAAR